MWVERGARVGLIAASQFIETKVSPPSIPSFTRSYVEQDFAAATALLEPLVVAQVDEPTSAELRAALGRVYLQAGQLDRAEAHFAAVAAAAADDGTLESTKALNAAFLASARGEWDAASEILRELFAQDDTNYAASIMPICSVAGV
jgi:tetratricopeptide (TPR) repeat protein